MGAVLRFPGKSLVAVLTRPDSYWIVPTKIGIKEFALQVAYPTLSEAVREIREGAALCGWRYAGVFDEKPLHTVEDWHRHSGPGDAA